jgi:hypothetical protein
MDTIAKAYELLCSTESKLAELAAEATTSRDYENAGRILATVQALKRLTEQYDAAPKSINPQNGISIANAESKQEAKPTRVRGTNRLGEYPRFFKSGNRLVKVGWSKKDRTEYEHKCPRNVLSALISSFLSTRSNGKRFSMDDVLPLTDPIDGSELPTYQIYVALAWLKSIGLVEQHGRQGYSIRKGINLSAKVDDAWNSLR